jgi:hypothetical protein
MEKKRMKKGRKRVSSFSGVGLEKTEERLRWGAVKTRSSHLEMSES